MHSGPPLTLAQRSNFLALTAWGYSLWRARALTLLSGNSFSLAREAALFCTLCTPRPGSRWLDVGTSAGFYAGVLHRQGCKVWAADLSPAMLRVAERREGSGICWQQVNLEHSGWPAAQFEGITVGATLNETASPARLLSELERLLRPGGTLWLMWVPGTAGPGQGILQRVAGLHFPSLARVQSLLPGCSLRHAVRFGAVQFAQFTREGGGES
ncbi:class I SAM-dependent methyltransferase [Deinococcus lacus]|uniref:Class I SAM-dependent methyltransferase n=1 Tax=Deinococcus lacus TaxID=392561 RepID=A0ABW1YCD0_9DEIO